MDAILDRVKDLFGGGMLSPVMIIVGLFALYLAFKVVSGVAKLVMGVVSIAMFLGVAPWSGASALEGAVADCASTQASAELSGADSIITKRVEIISASPDAACNAGGDALAAGSARAQLRTFYDLPYRKIGIRAGR